MDFQISALPEQTFAPLYGLSDQELNARHVRPVIASSNQGFPCRVSLRDAEIGERVLLMHFEHQPHPTPYRASHAVYVIDGARQATPAPNHVPELLRSRLLSLRAFDARHDMVAADVVHGQDLEAAIDVLGALKAVDYVHIHNAKPGCYAARLDFL